MGGKKNISVMILAAGNSDRMAFPKPFLKWNEKFTFIEKIIDTYNNYGCKNIVAVFNAEVYKLFCEKHPNYQDNHKLTLVLNEHPEYERFYSIKKGIAALGKIDYCFIQNIDNPFVNYSIIESLIASTDENDYYVPTYKGKGGHPVLINKKIIGVISITSLHNIKLNQFLCQFSRKNVIIDDKTVLYNINTIEEYQKFL